jgi:flagellar FliJ protein
MKKSKRIKPIIRIAESKEQHAAIELGRAQNQLQEQFNRLQDLLNYQQEYCARYEETGRSGVSIHKLQSFRSFLDKLEVAIEQQKQAVKLAEELVQKRKQQWFASRDKVKMYNKVSSNFVKAETKQEEKQEQKDTDERAQRFR